MAARHVRHQGQRAHDAVDVGQHVEEAGRRHGGGQRSDIGDMAAPPRQPAAAPAENRRVEHRCGQNAGALRAGPIGEEESEHGRPPPQRLGQRGVTRIGLGEDEVEPDDRSALALEQLLRQRGDALARPGPAADARQAGVVDVDDHDARVARAGHRGTQARIVDGQVDLLQRSQRHQTAGVHQGQRQREAQQGPAKQSKRTRAHAPGCARQASARRIRPARTASACRRARPRRRSSAARSRP